MSDYQLVSLDGGEHTFPCPVVDGRRMMLDGEFEALLTTLEEGDALKTNLVRNLTVTDRKTWKKDGDVERIEVSCDGEDGGKYRLRYYRGKTKLERVNRKKIPNGTGYEERYEEYRPPHKENGLAWAVPTDTTN